MLRMMMGIAALCASLVLLGQTAATLTSVECFVIVSIGTGTPFPAQDRFGESKLIRWGRLNTEGTCTFQFSCAIDAGMGAILSLFNHGFNSNDLDCLIYTHGHLDHIQDVPGLAYQNALNGGTAVPKALCIFGPDSALPAIVETLQKGIYKYDADMRKIGTFGANFRPSFLNYTNYLGDKGIDAGFPIVQVWPRSSSHNESFLGTASLELQNCPHTEFTGFNSVTNTKNPLFTNFTSVSVRLRIAGWNLVFAGDMSNRNETVGSFRFGHGLATLAKDADFLQIHPYYDSACPHGCPTCIPPAFRLIHTHLSDAALQIRKMDVGIVMVSHPNPPFGLDTARIGSSGLWDPEAPENPNRNALAPFLPKFSQPVTGQDYVDCLRKGGQGFRNEIIAADEHRESEILGIDTRVTSIWVVDATTGTDLFELLDGAMLNVDVVKSLHHAPLLTLRAEIQERNAAYVSWVSWLVDGVLEDGAANRDKSEPFCINSWQDGGEGSTCLPSELLEGGGKQRPVGDVTISAHPYFQQSPTTPLFRGAPKFLTITLTPASHAAGCADGSREAFTDPELFPNVAGCAGAWQHHGVALDQNLVPMCDRREARSIPPAAVSNCSAADLCQRGWHVCSSIDDVLDSIDQEDEGCASALADFPAGSFFATRVSGPGNGQCDDQDVQWKNDVFGCGVLGATPDYATCPGLTRFSHNLCSALSPEAGWVCEQTANGETDAGEPWEEAAEVVHRNSTDRNHGVLCCRGYEPQQNSSTTLSAGPTCEGGFLHLACPHHRTIKVRSATFGREEGEAICANEARWFPGVDVTSPCHADPGLALHSVASVCDGRASCSMLVSVATFGEVDPCVGTVKYSEVLYSCGDEV